ncbi:flagellar assembly protein FliH [Virgibacillus halophilus]|uniref:Flagellar assembly protein FliH n=1 Tax=Tigheibacillus halophilus TaxID=361280 RepID=A0ABU5CAM4_9BACI|nr:flagellar assembly protein FliH [Virgibacillus halophilus]
MIYRQKKKRVIQETAEWIEQEKTAWAKEKLRLIEQAKAAGYQEGFRVGEQTGIAQYDSLIAKINEFADTAQKDYVRTISQADDAIMQIAIAAADKILRRQLQHNPEAFYEIVVACIQEAGDAAKITIFVHPQQYEMLIHQKNELQNLLDENAKLLIKVSKTIPEFSCILEHPLGQIDASVDTQLGQIRQALEEIRAGK